MEKKCIICDAKAEFNIKGTREYYCRECAEEHFADLSLLIKVEEVAKRLKDIIESRSRAPQEEEIEEELKKKDKTNS